MWPFKKKEELVKVLQEFDVGKTFIEVTLKDGRVLKIYQIGSVYQSLPSSRPIVYSSLETSQYYIKSLMQTTINFSLSDNEVAIGEPISAKILNTVTHKIKEQVWAKK